MACSSESRWFKVSVLVASAVGVGYTAWQLSIASSLRSYITKNPKQTTFDASSVEWSFWISMILLIIFIILLIWAAYKLLLSSSYREKINKNVEEFFVTPGGGFEPGTTDNIMVRPVEASRAQNVLQVPAGTQIIHRPVGARTASDLFTI